MQKLFIKEGHRTPEIIFSPDENLFCIRGTSSPEDVRTMYYPVIEWIREFTEEQKNDSHKNFTDEDPMKFQMDLSYFNSSSAKFFYDMLSELKKLEESGTSVRIEWYYDEDDTDMKDAGDDFSGMLDMKFDFLPKSA